MLRVCVIGMGNIGNLHAKIYKEIRSEDGPAQLSGVCDLNEDRARKAGAMWNVPWFTDTEKMLKELKPDLCSVATGGYEYSSDHFLPTIQALNANCHVLGEKPISNDMAHAREMVKLAKEKNLCYGIDLNHRFTPAARTAKKWQDDGRLGHLLFCNMALWIGKFGEFESPYYHLKALNPHSIDIMRYFMGEIEKVQCFAMQAPKRNIWSTASINMVFKNGAVGHLTSSYDIARGHPMERCEVAGTAGRLVFDDMWREAVLYPAGDFVKQVYTNPIFDGFSNFDDTFRDRIKNFVKQVKDGTPPDQIDGSGESGYRASLVIHAAIKSLDNNNCVINVADCENDN